MMLQKKSNPWARLKYTYVLPLAAVAVAVFAHPEISQPFEEISSAKVSHFAFETSTNEVKNLPESEISVVHENPAEVVNTPDITQDNRNFVFTTVENPPEFPGGEAALLQWISENMNYPTAAKEQGISGRVYCQFIVEDDGSVSNIEVTRSRDPFLDAEAIRALSTLPKFKPGTQRGVPVRVRYSVPVNFVLSSGTVPTAQ